MHSRIFQIEEEEVSTDVFIHADAIPEWFTVSVADYVADVDDVSRDEAIEWLMQTNFGKVCQRDDDKITFKMDVIDFFEEDFNSFKKVIEELTEVDINHFIYPYKSVVEKSLADLMYLLREAYDDEYRFYVWHYGALYTMQSWMRHVKPAGTYYIGGVVDYHF